MKPRYIVITDIYLNKRKPWAEVDDVQSLVRLLLYSNDIEIEGIIASTSCFYKRGGKKRDLDIILDIINTYGQVKPNLDKHAKGYPDAEYLSKVACVGIQKFGKKPGKGFANEIYNNNPGVNRIIEAVDKEDDRPVWIGLWGGANTLAQAVWKVWKTRTETDFKKFLSKIRIYGISDQDSSSGWLREMFGDQLFYIVSPSLGTMRGTKNYALATWPGISGDKGRYGSSDGRTPGGFKGARADLVSKEWIKENIISHGLYGAQYPLPVFIMEGDSPSYLGLIPNGLNKPENPGYGGWGGRYLFYRPDKKQFNLEEKYPIWTNASDTVEGIDRKIYTSPQATIWRWREAFQNDFAARMDWTVSEDFNKANHPPIVKLNHNSALTAHEEEYVILDARPSKDPDGDKLYFNWFNYKEAGDCCTDIHIENHDTAVARFQAPKIPEGMKNLTLHIILEVKDGGTPSLTQYQRVIITVI